MPQSCWDWPVNCHRRPRGATDSTPRASNILEGRGLEWRNNWAPAINFQITHIGTTIGTTLSIPADLAGEYAVILFYRGIW